MGMPEKTNKERLSSIETAIINIDKNFIEFKDDYKENDIRKWKSINQNCQDISKIKGIGIVVSLVFTAVCGFLGIKS